MKTGYRRYNSIEDRYEARLDQGISEVSKKVLREWASERRANKFRDSNTLGLIGTVVLFLASVNKEIEDLTKQDVQNFFSRSNLSITSELWYKKAIKRFFIWLSKQRDDPKYLLLINWIDTKQLSSKCSERSSKHREDNCPSPEEVRKMISSAPLLRDKLAISLLADTGVRAETIGAGRNNRSINIGQVKFYQGYAIIENIEEKFDKKRDIIITESLSYLIKYWNELPEDYKKKSDKPLFMGYSNNRYGKRWGYSGLKDMLQSISKQATGRIINPHDFRHMKATRLEADDRLSDDSKCKLMGWSSRRMLDRYSHTKFEEAKDEYLSKKGIITLSEQKKKVQGSILKPKECLICHNINSSTDELCEKCGNSLNYEGMIENFTQGRETENRFMESLKKLNRISPEAMVKFVDAISKIDEGAKK